MIKLQQCLLLLFLARFIEAQIKGDNASSNLRRRAKKKEKKKGGKQGGKGNNGKNGGGKWTSYEGRFPDPPVLASILSEPEGLPSCVSFANSRVYVTPTYPGDKECQSEFGITTSGACCRVYEFNDRFGPQTWLLYDAYNMYTSVPCVCNQNTKASTGYNGYNANDGIDIITNSPVVSAPPSVNPTAADTTYQDGIIDFQDGIFDVDPLTLSPDGIPNPTPTLSPQQPTVATVVTKQPVSNGICAAQNLSTNQQLLQGSTYLKPCEDSSDCGSSTCCYKSYCVCWNTAFLTGRASNPGCLA